MKTYSWHHHRGTMMTMMKAITIVMWVHSSVLAVSEDAHSHRLHESQRSLLSDAAYCKSSISYSLPSHPSTTITLPFVPNKSHRIINSIVHLPPATSAAAAPLPATTHALRQLHSKTIFEQVQSRRASRHVSILERYWVVLPVITRPLISLIREGNHNTAKILVLTYHVLEPRLTIWYL